MWSIWCGFTNLRDYNQLVPIGCVGEIVIEGPTVARGYLNLPGKTIEVFIKSHDWLPERQQTFEGRRLLCKSGDLGRYNADGAIDFLGHKDHQVKPRGQRIELGEIEYHISTHAHDEHALVAGSERISRVYVLSVWSAFFFYITPSGQKDQT